MHLDPAQDKIAIVVDGALPSGLAANAAAVVAATLGLRTTGMIGADARSADGVHVPGITRMAMPILKSDVTGLTELHRRALIEPELFTVPFTAAAQAARGYDEYLEGLAAQEMAELALVALGIAGPRARVSSLAGSLPLLR
ncbi:DUF2000 domain-containing protein [Cellulomonas sp. NPDC089187]|uniref:DUF2000 domain-containing protein n=1 Tax=Cellulomonas sp. NPDC089187 TaxID=3154970 RepID=UPI003433BB1B